MKFFMVLTLGLFVAACQPQTLNQVTQQQHHICKSLIEGFLKIQNLGNYQFEEEIPNLHHTAQSRNYKFKTSPDNQMRLNMPKQQNLEFECIQNQAQHFEVKLLDKHHNQAKTILSLQLPLPKSIKTLTAYALQH